jgi:hypothetical protein
VKPALSLIEYNPQIHPAMQWVFGQTFICKDMETAKKVTFHERILKKSVTLDGDVFDPSGTLSGGKYSTVTFRIFFEWMFLFAVCTVYLKQEVMSIWLSAVLNSVTTEHIRTVLLGIYSESCQGN